MNMMVDGEVYVVSMMWYGPKKTDPETGVFTQPNNLITRVYDTRDDVKSADEAFGRAYGACLADFGETGWTLKNYTVVELETLWNDEDMEEE